MAKTRTPQSAGLEAGDVLVIFGITGDLAKVMTFHSLYRLEARGLLTGPIVGVAVDDWTVDQLVERARDSIVGTGEKLKKKVFDRLAARLDYVSGDFNDAATYKRVGKAIKGAKQPVFYLEIPPFLFGTVVKGLSEAGLTENARVVVEKPFGHDLESARALAERAPPVRRRVADLPDRPLPREDGPPGDPLPPVCQHDARARLEPELRRLRRDHHGRGLRRGGPRPLLRPGRRAPRRRRQPPHAGGRRHRDGGAVRGRHRDAQGRDGRALSLRSRGGPGPLRPRPVRRLPRRSTGSIRSRRRRRTRPCGSRSTTGAGQGSRSSSARESDCRPCRPRSGSSSSARRDSASGSSTRPRHATSSRSSSTPRPACRTFSTPSGPT